MVLLSSYCPSNATPRCTRSSLTRTPGSSSSSSASAATRARNSKRSGASGHPRCFFPLQQQPWQQQHSGGRLWAQKRAPRSPTPTSRAFRSARCRACCVCCRVRVPPCVRSEAGATQPAHSWVAVLCVNAARTLRSCVGGERSARTPTDHAATSHTVSLCSYHYDKVSCMKGAYFAHVTFCYLVFLSGIGACECGCRSVRVHACTTGAHTHERACIHTQRRTVTLVVPCRAATHPNRSRDAPHSSAQVGARVDGQGVHHQHALGHRFALSGCSCVVLLAACVHHILACLMNPPTPHAHRTAPQPRRSSSTTAACRLPRSFPSSGSWAASASPGCSSSFMSCAWTAPRQRWCSSRLRPATARRQRTCRARSPRPRCVVVRVCVACRAGLRPRLHAGLPVAGLPGLLTACARPPPNHTHTRRPRWRPTRRLPSASSASRQLTASSCLSAGSTSQVCAWLGCVGGMRACSIAARLSLSRAPTHPSPVSSPAHRARPHLCV